jgi:hypothetical protein
VIHHPSGARGESREERSQLQNKRAAFLRMVKTPKFDLWLRLETGRLVVLDSRIAIPPSEVKVEVRSGGRWILAPIELHDAPGPAGSTS